MPVSLDQSIRQAIASTVITLEEIDAVLATLSDEQEPRDGEELMRLLVNQRKLTLYQSQQILKGRGSSLVFGNYVILDRLGKGGMGLVLKAEHRRMRRVVALKVFTHLQSIDPAAMRRFQREVEAIAKLEHPNIVVAHDADEVNGTQFLVMQYVEGTDLQVLVRHLGPLPVDTAVSYVIQAAIGLEYAHARGVIHRDIKPANLLLDRQGTIKILDMGLARLESGDLNSDELTDTGQIMGTADYMAPEQALDTKSADARADIYSLGATLWFLLTGEPVYKGDSVVDKLQALQNATTPLLCNVCPHATLALEAVVTKMIAKQREARYQTMAEVIVGLQRTRPGSPWNDPGVNEVSNFPEPLPNMVDSPPPSSGELNISAPGNAVDDYPAPTPNDTFATVYNKPVTKPAVAELPGKAQTLSIQSATVDTDPEMHVAPQRKVVVPPDATIVVKPAVKPRVDLGQIVTYGIIVVLLAMVIFLVLYK